MPRQMKKGLSYFNLDCDIFSAKSGLKPLLRRFKADGLTLYIHILCDVYSSGYYYRPDNYEDYLYELSEDCGISVDKVKLILTFMADRTLLDAFSLNKNTVFTSHGIQKHYVEAMKGRKHSVAEIRGEYWLLSPEEEVKLDTFYKSTLFADNSEKMTDNSEKMTDNSEILDTNKIKGNKRELSQISKKESNKEKKNQSYDELFENMGVKPIVKEALIEFIRHLQANGTILINSRLEDIIVGLDMRFMTDESAKVKYIKDAISKGYKRLPFEGED